MIEGKDHGGGPELDTLRAARHVRQEHGGRRENTEAAEVVLGQPDAVIAHGFGLDAFLDHLEKKLIGVAPGRSIGGAVVGEGEIAELHRGSSSPRSWTIDSALAATEASRRNHANATRVRILARCRDRPDR
jgi:hypothetical protein